MSVVEFVIKIILIACNAILTLIVVANVIVTFANMGKPSKYHDMVSKSFGKSAMAIQIAVNTFILVIIALGWFGIFKKNRICLLVYAIVVLIFGIILLIVGIALLAMVKGIEAGRSLIVEKLNKTYEDYATNMVTKKMMDELHAYYECCGADKPVLINNEYPKSCCQALDGGKCLQPYQKPCVDVLLMEAAKETTEFGSISVIFGLFLVCAGIAATTYRRYIRLVQ